MRLASVARESGRPERARRPASTPAAAKAVTHRRRSPRTFEATRAATAARGQPGGRKRTPRRSAELQKATRLDGATISEGTTTGWVLLAKGLTASAGYSVQ